MTEAAFQPIPKQPKQKTVLVEKKLDIGTNGTSWIQAFQAILQGMWTTLRHLFRKPTTFNYPDVKRQQSTRFRGIHRLQRHPDGKERCVGCGLCSVVCPSNAIFLEARENTPDNQVSHGERYASLYQIDMLRCIFCGYCEEACPEDAIVLGPNWESASTERNDFIYTKDRLLVPVELKHVFRPGMKWSGEAVETTPTSAALPEYYLKQLSKKAE
ncbi:NADH-quinone oxidoreductase subunit NuoI [bacterium]|nr:NADH-quinone oxidoreductase subunit NuoI [bacterium]